MSALFTYPKSAAYGRVLPKNKVYQHGKLGKRAQQLFVDSIQRIVWDYKLAPDTINLPASDTVREIQIFIVHLRDRNIREEALAAIDKAVAFPIIFELHFEDQIKVMACHKRANEADPRKWVVSDYFGGDWVNKSTARIPLPVALDMGALYDALLTPLMPAEVVTIARDKSVDLRTKVVRIEQLKAAEAQIAKIEARLSREKQFNRKVEINTELREAKASYRAMTVEPLS